MKAPEEHNTMKVTMKNRNKINKVNKYIKSYKYKVIDIFDPNGLSASPGKMMAGL